MTSSELTDLIYSYKQKLDSIDLSFEEFPEDVIPLALTYTEHCPKEMRSMLRYPEAEFVCYSAASVQWDGRYQAHGWALIICSRHWNLVMVKCWVLSDSALEDVLDKRNKCIKQCHGVTGGIIPESVAKFIPYKRKSARRK